MYWFPYLSLAINLIVIRYMPNYFSWKWWYSAIYYFAAFVFVRWHLHFIRSN